MTRNLEPESFRIRREWAKTAVQQFRFRYPEFPSPLHEWQGRFFVLVETEEARFNELYTEFDRNIRPLTCPIHLVRDVNTSAVLVDESKPFSAEIWLNGEPLAVTEMNTLFHLTAPGLPAGGIDFNHEIDAWIFMTPGELSDDKKEIVKNSFRKLGLDGQIEFQIVEPHQPQPLKPDTRMDIKSNILRGSNSHSLHSQAAQHLIARDEDLWRNFLEHRVGEPQGSPTIHQMEFSCLFDLSDRSEVRLSELLTIYDRVDIIPDRQNSDWLLKHGLSVDELMQLVNLGRCRVILPYGAEHCRPDILDGLASIETRSPVLSRELAAKTFSAGQSKDPLLYGPFTTKQRSDLLHAMQGFNLDDPLQAMSTSYGQMFARQHHSFMLNGAMASMNCGIGAHLGEIITRARGIDAQIELSVAGAGVEWAMALGSSWMPRSFGGGYDETNNSHLIASFISRTPGVPVDPVTSRLHAITDGLLAVTDVPPLEVARNFNGASVARFRTLARRLMQQAPTQVEILECIEEINRETRHFEKRTERLTRWKLDALAAAAVAKPIGDVIDTTCGGGFASVLAFWLFDHLKERVPSKLAHPLAEVRDAVLGLALAPSMDAVIVSRARSQLLSSS